MSAWTGGLRRYAQGTWGQVHLREWGEGPPLVLLHQTPWSSVQFHRVGPLLAEAGFRVIAPDTPGYGLSDAPAVQPTIEDYADSLAHALQDLGVGWAYIGGHHTGALIAAALAARRPDRVEGLILDNAPFYDEDERALRLSTPHHSHPPVEGGGHYADRWAFLRRMADPEMSAETLHLAITAFYLNSPKADFGHAAAYAWAMTPALDAIKTPTLVLSSARDPIHAHGDRLIAARPDWRRVLLDSGSASVLEHPQRWSLAVTGFLTSLARVEDAGAQPIVRQKGDSEGQMRVRPAFP